MRKPRYDRVNSVKLCDVDLYESIPPRTRELLNHLRKEAGDGYRVKISHEQIADALEMAQSDVSRRIQDLINKCYVNRYSPEYEAARRTNVPDCYDLQTDRFL